MAVRQNKGSKTAQGVWQGRRLRADRGGSLSYDQKAENGTPNEGGFKHGGNAGDAVALPYPEATYWGPNTGNKLFATGAAPANPTILTNAAGEAITTGSGAAITV